jgi:hypothetical protein
MVRAVIEVDRVRLVEDAHHLVRGHVVGAHGQEMAAAAQALGEGLPVFRWQAPIVQHGGEVGGAGAVAVL